jgi:outer membrane protein
MGMMVLPLTLTAQKFAYVQVQSVLGEWEEYGEVARQLDLDIRKAQFEFQGMTFQLDSLQGVYNAQQAMLSPTGRREKEAEIIEHQKRVQEFQLNQTNEFSRKQQEAEGPLLERFQLAVQKVANDRGYDLIFDAAMLLNRKPVFDVTEDVLYELRRGEQSSPDGN